jgi:hypothetical protein
MSVLRVSDTRMTVRSRHLVVGAIAIGIGVGVSGCATVPTSVYAIIDADATVSGVRILRLIVARTSDPAQRSSNELASSATSDAADRPGPFQFPFGFPLTFADSLAGPVTITIEGLDWDTRAVIAVASTDVIAVEKGQTVATLTLTAVRGGSNDGGVDGGPDATTDASP